MTDVPEVARPLVLPLPTNPTTLAHAPLHYVVCQVRVEAPTLADGGTALAVQKALGYERATKADSPQIRQVTSEPGGTAQEVMIPFGPSWQILSAADRWQVTLSADSFAIETNSYEDWDTAFRPQLMALIEAVSKAVSPRISTRIGLRYVNAVSGEHLPGSPPWLSPSAVCGIISPLLSGPICDHALGGHVTGQQGMIAIDLGGQGQVLLRHGLVRRTGGTFAYLLDLDAAEEHAMTFSVAALGDRADALNKAALGVFQHSLTPGALERMKEEASDASEDGRQA